MTTAALLGLATLAITDTLRRLSPWELHHLVVRVLTLGSCLTGAWLWAPGHVLLTGLAGVGVAVLLPAAIPALGDAPEAFSVRTNQRPGSRQAAAPVRRRVPDLPR